MPTTPLDRPSTRPAPGDLRSWLAAFIWILAISLAPAVAATADDLLSEVDPYSTLFCTDDLDELDRLAALSSEQREAIQRLMTDALADTSKLQRGFRDRCTQAGEEFQHQQTAGMDAEKMQEAEREFRSKYQVILSQWVASLAELEKRALNDIRSALTKDQLDRGWPAFERYRRDTLWNSSRFCYGLSTHPRKLVDALQLSPSDREACNHELSRLEAAVEPKLLLRMAAYRRSLSRTDVNTDLDNWIISGEWQMVAINRVFTHACIAIEKSLSEDAAAKFVQLRASDELGLERIERSPGVAAALSLRSLTPAQREALSTEVSKANQDRMTEAIEQLRKRDRERVSESTPASTDLNDAFDRQLEAQNKAAQRAAEFYARLRQLLTDEQRDELDARQSIDPRDLFKQSRRVNLESPWFDPPATPGVSGPSANPSP